MEKELKLLIDNQDIIVENIMSDLKNGVFTKTKENGFICLDLAKLIFRDKNIKCKFECYSDGLLMYYFKYNGVKWNLDFIPEKEFFAVEKLCDILESNFEFINFSRLNNEIFIDLILRFRKEQISKEEEEELRIYPVVYKGVKYEKNMCCDLFVKSCTHEFLLNGLGGVYLGDGVAVYPNGEIF